MTLFITENDIKKWTPASYNVDAKELFSHSVDAQTIKIQELLGSAFYNELYTNFLDNNLSPEEDKLIKDFIVPSLVWRSLHYAIPFLSNKILNKGVIKYTDENGNQSLRGEMGYLRNIINERATWRENIMVKFIYQNINDYPTFEENMCNNKQLINPSKKNNKQNIIGGIFFR